MEILHDQSHYQNLNDIKLNLLRPQLTLWPRLTRTHYTSKAHKELRLLLPQHRWAHTPPRPDIKSNLNKLYSKLKEQTLSSYLSFLLYGLLLSVFQGKYSVLKAAKGYRSKFLPSEGCLLNVNQLRLVQFLLSQGLAQQAPGTHPCLKVSVPGKVTQINQNKKDI